MNSVNSILIIPFEAEALLNDSLGNPQHIKKPSVVTRAIGNKVCVKN
jgi:hypothetical protein